jgi:hypothetical protein
MGWCYYPNRLKGSRGRGELAKASIERSKKAVFWAASALQSGVGTTDLEDLKNRVADGMCLLQSSWVVARTKL